MANVNDKKKDVIGEYQCHGGHIIWRAKNYGVEKIQKKFGEETNGYLPYKHITSVTFGSRSRPFLWIIAIILSLIGITSHPEISGLHEFFAIGS